MIGTFVFLRIKSKAPRPPLSPAPTPSTSSIKIKVLCILISSADLIPIDYYERSLSIVSIEFLFRVSDALSSNISKHNNFARSLIVEVFPIPGGPLNIKPLAFGSLTGLSFFLVIKTGFFPILPD